MQLSKNFELSEFIHSGALNKDLSATDDQINVIKTLVMNIMQPLRDYVGSPIHINSCLRTKESNDAIREEGNPASTTSDHMIPAKVVTVEDFEKDFNNNFEDYVARSPKLYGIENPLASGAVDFTIFGWTTMKIFGLFYYCIVKYEKFANQIIFYPDKNFIHISNARHCVFPFNKPSIRPILIHMNGKYVPYIKEQVARLVKAGKLPS